MNRRDFVATIPQLLLLVKFAPKALAQDFAGLPAHIASLYHDSIVIDSLCSPFLEIDSLPTPTAVEVVRGSGITAINFTVSEVQQLVAEFVSSGKRRTEFCRSRGLSFGTLDRHLKKQRWKKKSRRASSCRRVGAGGVGHQEIADESRTELWDGRGAVGRAPNRSAARF